MVKVTCNFLYVCTITIHLFSPYIIQHGICIKIYSTPGQDIEAFIMVLTFLQGKITSILVYPPPDLQQAHC